MPRGRYRPSRKSIKRAVEKVHALTGRSDTWQPREKRRLLNFVLSNCSWEDGEVVATFRQPFDMLAETATAAADVGVGEKAKSSKSEIWLGDLDSNQD